MKIKKIAETLNIIKRLLKDDRAIISITSDNSGELKIIVSLRDSQKNSFIEGTNTYRTIAISETEFDQDTKSVFREVYLLLKGELAK